MKLEGLYLTSRRFVCAVSHRHRFLTFLDCLDAYLCWVLGRKVSEATVEAAWTGSTKTNVPSLPSSIRQVAQLTADDVPKNRDCCNYRPDGRCRLGSHRTKYPSTLFCDYLSQN